MAKIKLKSMEVEFSFVRTVLFENQLDYFFKKLKNDTLISFHKFKNILKINWVRFSECQEGPELTILIKTKESPNTGLYMM